MSANLPNNVFQFPLPLMPPTPEPKTTKGWSYLISDSVAFKKDVLNAIRIQKPTQEKIPLWIRKLITSGQCTTIYVEDLSLPEQEQESIRRLCQEFSVSVVNVGVCLRGNQPVGQNVVIGPW
ncbi:deoxyguanosinetriphosphate triphosphohydrolase [Alteromonas aestuariivivens]|uniref:deoxyguanosinetriphosphate triphosphohydrolase n=1 Tax=Alteromonas aestuariivivens TaxID=1938339 RepID=UPI001FEB8BA6|nr:deoxyguanosinetriphosphate triphosphohydrolase [Alteromonas aestuariivivens]